MTGIQEHSMSFFLLGIKTLFFLFKKEKGFAGDEVRTRVGLRHTALNRAPLAHEAPGGL